MVTPEPPVQSRRRSRLLVLLAVGLLAVGAAWWVWGRKAEPSAEPPVASAPDDPELDVALQKARQKVTGEPTSAAAWGEYGSLLLANQFERESDRCFEEAARLDPANPRWPYARARIAVKRDTARAPELLRRTLAVGNGDPFRVHAQLALADLLLEQGKHDEAASLYREVPDADAARARADLGLGQIALAARDFDAAQRHLSRAVADARSARAARALLAELARGRGDEAQAAAHEKAAAAVESAPPWPDPLLEYVVSLQVGQRARLRQAEEFERDGRHAEAAELHLQCLARERTARSLVGAGFNLAQSGSLDRGLALMREGVQKDPSDARNCTRLASVLFAVAELELHRSPGSSRARPWLEEAATHARRAAEAKPDFAPAYLYWGLSYKLLGDPKASVDPLRKGVAVRPDDFEMNLGLGQVLAASGNPAEAERWLRNAREIDPKDPRPERELAAIGKK